MIGHEVFVALSCKNPAVHEEEHEDDEDAGEDAVPKLPVHACFDCLLAFDEVLGGEVERV